MSCQPTVQNLAIYLQGVTVKSSNNITSEYFVTASLPSSAQLRRVWQFQSQGTLSDTSTLTLDYTAAHDACPEFNITFEGALNGTFIVHNQVFSANKYISYELVDTYVLVLTLKVPKSILECYGVGTIQNYSFTINLNDAAVNTSLSFDYEKPEDINSTLTNSSGSCTWSSTQTYYYSGSCNDATGNPIYTGYLQIVGSGNSSTSCVAPSALSLSITSLPTSGVALLGIEFDNSQGNPGTLTINNATSPITLPQVAGSGSDGYGGVILVYDASSSSWSLQTTPSGSSTTFYAINSPNNTISIEVSGATGATSVIYVSSFSSGTTPSEFSLNWETSKYPSSLYISFALTLTNKEFLYLDFTNSTTDIYLANPSSSQYSSAFVQSKGSTYEYTTSNGWQQSPS